VVVDPSERLDASAAGLEENAGSDTESEKEGPEAWSQCLYK